MRGHRCHGETPVSLHLYFSVPGRDGQVDARDGFGLCIVLFGGVRSAADWTRPPDLPVIRATDYAVGAWDQAGGGVRPCASSIKSLAIWCRRVSGPQRPRDALPWYDTVESKRPYRQR